MIIRAALIAALYFVLTFMTAPISFGSLQFRVAEALTVLPIFMPEAVIGLTIGCLLANVFSPFGWYDMLFGTLATFIAAAMTYFIGTRFKKETNILVKTAVGGIPPIIVNASILPAVWLLFGTDALYFINFASVFLTQAGTVMLIGVPLAAFIDKSKIIK